MRAQSPATDQAPAGADALVALVRLLACQAAQETLRAVADGNSTRCDAKDAVADAVDRADDD